MARKPGSIQREPFTVRVLPDTREALRRWAFENDTNAGRVIDRLAADYLDRLDADKATA